MTPKKQHRIGHDMACGGWFTSAIAVAFLQLELGNLSIQLTHKALCREAF